MGWCRMNPLNQPNNLKLSTESVSEIVATVDAVIECPRGSKLKTEVDKDSGIFRAERYVRRAFPSAYGFVPSTLADDGDCIDIFVMTNQDLPVGITVQVDIVGAIDMKDLDDVGCYVDDTKLLGIIRGEGLLGGDRVGAIREFLKKYKDGTVVEPHGPMNNIRAYRDLKVADGKVRNDLGHPMHGVG